MKFILDKQIKHCTKDIIKYIKIVTIALLIIVSIIFIKYKPVCSVSILGEQIGYISNKNQLEQKIQEYTKKENVAYIQTLAVPEYKFSFIKNNEEIDENNVFNKIKAQIKITYQYYAVTIDGNQKAVVKTLDEAEKLVNEAKKEYKNNECVNIGINKVYTKNQEEYKVENIEIAKKEVTKELEKIEKASVNGVYLEQKPITGVITSRFGERERIRSHAHTGLDIAAPYGTKIKASASGTIVWAGYKGSYGNLIITNCGNGVEIYYGHCSKIYVKKGQKVKAGEVIGQVGSTGNSTGNHLHFEIRVNKIRVNPQNYIYK